MQRIDCRGMKCPLPVITVKKAIDAGNTVFEALVDNDIARQNVLKLLASNGLAASVAADGADFVIAVGGATAQVMAKMNENKPGEVVYLITTELLGDGDAELGRILMRSLLFTISERPAPRALVLMNRGVFLACEGSEHLETLQKIAANGAEVLACGTCLDFYGLKDKLRAGEPGNMYSALELMEQCRVIKI